MQDGQFNSCALNGFVPPLTEIACDDLVHSIRAIEAECLFRGVIPAMRGHEARGDRVFASVAVPRHRH